MTVQEYDNRKRLFHLGKLLRDMELDEDERVRIGKELIMLSGVCPACNGEGLDGDPPDANGVGGGQWACDKCHGAGFTVNREVANA